MKRKPLSPDRATREWLLDQIWKLAKDADDNAKTDAKNADDESTASPEAARYSAASEAAAHYRDELLRILTGKTWDEAFVERVRASVKS